MTDTTASNKVATKDAKTAVAQNLPFDSSNIMAYAGMGLQNATAEDFALPFLGVLQKMSPEVDKNEEKYIEGSEAGMFVNSSTRQIFSGNGLRIVPVEFEKVYNVWVPRNAGGGFKGSFKTAEEAAAKKANNPWDIVDTANHYVLVEIAADTWEPMIMSCTSTKLKVSRSWMSLMQRQMITHNGAKLTAPTFAKYYTLKTVAQKNEKGSYFTFAVTVEEGFVSADVFNQAMDFNTQLKSGVKGAVFNEPEVIEVEDEEEESVKY